MAVLLYNNIFFNKTNVLNKDIVPNHNLSTIQNSTNVLNKTKAQTPIKPKDSLLLASNNANKI